MNVFQNAKWIWCENLTGQNIYASFSNKINVTSKESKYTLYISVDSNYGLYINGKLVEHGQYADYPFDKIYDKIDITSSLNEGDNEIRFDVYNQGFHSSTIRDEQAGLIFSLFCDDKEISYSSENTLSCPLSNYAMGECEIITWQLGKTFHYDSNAQLGEKKKSILVNKEMPKRERPIKKLETLDVLEGEIKVLGGFNDKIGTTAAEKMQFAALGLTKITSRVKLPSKEGIKLEASEDFDGIFAIIDLNKESAGIANIQFEVEKECDVFVGWGEHLCDGRVRTAVGGRNFAFTYKAHPGMNNFVCPFKRLGGRYIQIHIYANNATLYYAGINPTNYPMEKITDFSCADELANTIYSTCINTLLTCMHEHYEDCPWREQALYGMDSRNQILTGYYTFGEYDMPKESIRLFAHSIRPDNLFELCPPAIQHMAIPAFTAMSVVELYEYYVHTKDKDFTLEMMPTMKRVVDGFIARLDTDLHVMKKLDGYWNFYEWQHQLDGFNTPDQTYEAPINAFAAMAIYSYARLCKLLNEDDYEKYHDTYVSIIENINKYFWNEEKGVYGSYIFPNGELSHYCELTNALMAYLTTSEFPNYLDRKEKVLAALKKEELIPVTLSFSVFKLESLLGGTCDKEHDNFDSCSKENARYVFGDIAKKWGYMLRNGATSFWETIIGAADFENAGSLCHGWSAIPAYFYIKYASNMKPEITGIYECQVTKK